MEQLLTAMRAAGESTRLRLLALLAHCDLTVTELAQILSQSQPRVSRHLKLLTDAGLIARYQEGTWVFYRLLRNGRGGDFASVLIGWLDDADEALQADARRLATVREARRRDAAQYFEDVAARWDRVRGLRVDESQVEARLRALGEAGTPRVMLDLGTGTGRVLELFAEELETGLGIDQSRKMLTIARTRLDDAGARNCQVRLGDIYNLDLPDGYADLITLHQVLHYLDDPAAAIAEACRVLRPGGQLIAVDLARHSLEFLRDEHAHRRLGFDEDEVAEWFRAAGLESLHVEHLRPENAPAAETLTVSIWSARQRTDAPSYHSLEVA